MMNKRINIQGIIILFVIIGTIQLGFGLGISPFLKTAIVEGINRNSGSRVAVDKAHIWPLTLSAGLKGITVYDPGDNTKIVEADKVSVRLSFLALLSKRIVVSSMKAGGVEIFLRRTPDGGFNIEALGESPAQAEGAKKSAAGAILDRFKGKKDWFGKIYDAVKNKSSLKSAEEEKTAQKESSKVTREVKALPKGRKVYFKTVRDEYLFEIRDLAVRDVKIHMKAENGAEADVEKADIRIKGMAMDPRKGISFNSLDIKGTIKKAGNKAGDFSAGYSRVFSRGTLRTDISVKAKNVDMGAISFIYDTSLPVTLEKGVLDLDSMTRITDGALDSRNSVLLKDQRFTAKSGAQLTAGFIPAAVLIDALNGASPIGLKFDIGGTVDKPEFSGFEDSLKQLAKPYMDKLKEQGKDAVIGFLKGKTGAGSGEASVDAGKEPTRNAADSIRSLFNK
ncbi:MAG: DUF748 domain-containing protein [Candidatus Omnitrophota bacterium]